MRICRQLGIAPGRLVTVSCPACVPVTGGMELSFAGIRGSVFIFNSRGFHPSFMELWQTGGDEHHPFHQCRQ